MTELLINSAVYGTMAVERAGTATLPNKSQKVESLKVESP
jgi:hypothetical protein